MQMTTKYNITGVMNDPLGQPTVPAGSKFRLIFDISHHHN